VGWQDAVAADQAVDLERQRPEREQIDDADQPPEPPPRHAEDRSSARAPEPRSNGID
jgi:hypothetical protein